MISGFLPKNKEGGSDEWRAMEIQKQRAIAAYTKEQKEREKIAKKAYKYFYQILINCSENLAKMEKFHELRREQELQTKKVEETQIKAEHKEYMDVIITKNCNFRLWPN